MHRIADNPDVDVVYVVTPNALHLDNALVAAKAGKHVFCEKPMEISAERCQQMIDAVEGASRMLGIGYRCRFEPHHLECVRIAREPRIRRRQARRCSLRVQHRARRVAFEARIVRRRAADGCWHLRVAGHALSDRRRAHVGFGRHHSGRSRAVRGSRGIGGVGGQVSRRRHQSLQQQLQRGGCRLLSGPAERGWFGLDPAFNYGGLRGMRSDGRAIDPPSTDQFAVEMDDFARCILQKTPTRVPGEEGLRDVQIMTAIYESARTGKPIQSRSAWSPKSLLHRSSPRAYAEGLLLQP